MRTQHPMAGKTVVLKSFDSRFDGAHYVVEDYCENVLGRSWMDATRNPAAINYAIRVVNRPEIRSDNEVVYGKIGAFGYLIHVSELGTEVVEK